MPSLLYFNTYYLQLEVEVETEGQVRSTQVQTEVRGIVVITIGIELIEADEAEVRNETDVVGEAHSQTGFETNSQLSPVSL